MTDPLSIVKVSIVTVCMNRRAHLLVSADHVSRWPHHQEHLILDWSSDQPLTRADLPADSRIRLVRVDGERQWHLCRAYNLALRLARGDRLFKLDADCWPEAMPSLEQLAAAGPVAAFCSGPDGRAGQWLLERRFVDQVGGFNEVLLGYGFDDKDFRSRVEAQGGAVQRLPASALGVIAHSASLRVSRSGEVSSPTAMQRVSAQSLKRATAITNRLLAAGHPWSAQRFSSEYDTDPTNGALRVQRPTIPRPSLQLDDEAQRLRRRIYWGLFFSLPEELVVRMPVRLLPNDLRGRFLLKPIHRWSWYLIRPLWAWPLLVVQALQRPSQSARAEQAVWLALEMVDWPALLDALQRLRRRQRRDLIVRLLFQRGLRPQDNTQQKELFSSLLNADVLDPDQRLYAGIALGWSLIRIADSKAATSLIDQLMLEASRLEVDPSTQKCQRR
ncbi:MAG: glycosyltransferase family A protein, partial [Parasynechococcus sp.]